MKRKRIGRNILVVLISIASVLIIGALVAWNTPLFGTRLKELDTTFNPDALEEVAPDDAEEESVPETTEAPESEDDTGEDNPADSESEEEAAENKEPVCNGPDSLNVLVLGIDENAQSDAIRLMHIDFVEPKVNVLSIPRDFYVPIADMADYGITKGRINATYGYGEKYLGKGKGIFSLAANLNYNFGVTFDHYVVLYFDNIAEYIDEIGGIDITLDEAVSDGSSYFGSGEHHMDGDTAVVFMRMRYYDDDFHRVRRQTLVIKAFYEKVMSDLTLLEQTQLGVQIITDKNVQTDFATKDLYPLACLAKEIDTSDVHFIEIPSNMYRPWTTEEGGAVQVPYDTVVPFIQSVMDGSYKP